MLQVIYFDVTIIQIIYLEHLFDNIKQHLFGILLTKGIYYTVCTSSNAYVPICYNLHLKLKSNSAQIKG